MVQTKWMVLLMCLVSSAMGDWVRFNLTEAAAKNGAVCLDGSVGGGYIKKGDPKKWIIFHQGGGWCSSDSNCLDRSNTSLGSSKSWGSNYTDLYEGSQLFETAPFSGFTLVFAMYCDGGSWTGNVSEPVTVGNSTIYYRGRRLLDGLLDYMLDVEGMKNADELIYAGCSAGGLTSYIHADYVASRVPSTVKTVALADAMFSLNHNSYTNQPLFPSRMQWGYKAWESQNSINQDCLKALGGADGSAGWRCMFGGETAQFVKTPLFVLNSKYDTWQEKAIIGVDCTITQCSPEIQKFWSAYSQIMVSKAQALPPQHGAFLTNCPAHCQAGISNWEMATINGVNMSDAFKGWYMAQMQVLHGERERASSASHRYIETCDVKPCGSDTC